MPIASSTILETRFGQFKVSYHNFGDESCVAFSSGDTTKEGTLVRLQSACLFSEAFHSIDCDCSLQLTQSLEQIGKEGGVVVYLFQEGRGHGLSTKIKAMETGRIMNIDNFEAFQELDLKQDIRDYSIAVRALKELAVNHKIKLITNDPRKRKQLEDGGFSVTQKVSLIYPLNEKRKKYLMIKKEKFGHNIEGLW